MPIYEYFCPQCQVKKEKLLKVVQLDETQMCDDCEAVLERQLSKPLGFTIEGGGVTGSNICHRK